MAERQQWEYECGILFVTTEYLDAMGSNGWELIVVEEPNEQGFRWCIFKRPKLESANV